MKKRLRDEIKTRLAAMTPDEISDKSGRIADLILSRKEFIRADVIMIYLPIAGEVDTAPIAERAWELSMTVVAPMACGKTRHMKPAICHPENADTLHSHHGLRQPVGTDIVDIKDIDLVIVPALAFDEKCNRLGRGGGFYDRFIDRGELDATTIGVCFTEQILPELPIESNDRPVDMVVTDRKIYARR